jgi:hypothetical protein
MADADRTAVDDLQLGDHVCWTVADWTVADDAEFLDLVGEVARLVVTGRDPRLGPASPARIPWSTQ